MHTPLCKHALGEPEEYAEVAIQRGLKGIIFTCHSPMPKGWWPQVRMADSEFDEYLRIVQRASDAFKGSLDIQVGIESDFFPGMEEWIEGLHERTQFHHVLGSVHFFGPEYKAKFHTGDTLALEKQYFAHLAESAETGLFDTLAHPDLVKNHDPRHYDFTRLQDTIESALARIAKTKVAMEINTSGLHKRYPETNPGLDMLQLMRKYEIPVVIGSDSHKPGRVGADFLHATQILADAGYTHASYFKERRRREVPLADIANSLLFEVELAAVNE